MYETSILLWFLCCWVLCRRRIQHQLLNPLCILPPLCTTAWKIVCSQQNISDSDSLLWQHQPSFQQHLDICHAFYGDPWHGDYTEHGRFPVDCLVNIAEKFFEVSAQILGVGAESVVVFSLL